MTTRPTLKVSDRVNNVVIRFVCSQESTMPVSSKTIPVGKGLEHPSGPVIGPCQRCSLEHLPEGLLRAALNDSGPLRGAHGFLPWRMPSESQLGFCRSQDPMIFGEGMSLWGTKEGLYDLTSEILDRLCCDFLWDVEICHGRDQILILARNEVLVASGRLRCHDDQGPILPKSVLVFEEDSFIFLNPEEDGYPSAEE